MNKSVAAFESEADLTKTASSVDPILPLIENAHFCEYELDGLFGVPDLVTANITANGEIESVAFEMKLTKWRRALRQAFRYRGFARKSYVVMDERYADRAARHSEKFQEARIGLLSVRRGDGKIKIYEEARSTDPYSPRLSGTFRQIVWREIQKRRSEEMVRQLLDDMNPESLWGTVPNLEWEKVEWTSPVGTVLSPA